MLLSDMQSRNIHFVDMSSQFSSRGWVGEEYTTKHGIGVIFCQTPKGDYLPKHSYVTKLSVLGPSQEHTDYRLTMSKLDQGALKVTELR